MQGMCQSIIREFLSQKDLIDWVKYFLAGKWFGGKDGFAGITYQRVLKS